MTTRLERLVCACASGAMATELGTDVFDTDERFVAFVLRRAKALEAALEEEEDARRGIPPQPADREPMRGD